MTYIYTDCARTCAPPRMQSEMDCRRWLSRVHTQRYRGHQSEGERETCSGRKEGGRITKGLAYVHLKVLAQCIFTIRQEERERYTQECLWKKYVIWSNNTYSGDMHISSLCLYAFFKPALLHFGGPCTGILPYSATSKAIVCGWCLHLQMCILSNSRAHKNGRLK